MTPRRALCLAAMALEFVSTEAPDVADWSQAAAVIRSLLAELRGPVPSWFDSPGEVGPGRKWRGTRQPGR